MINYSTTTNNKFSERLKDLREEKGLSRHALTKALSIGGSSTINRWETEKKEISIYYLIRLADFFDVSIDYLVGRVDD